MSIAATFAPAAALIAAVLAGPHDARAATAVPQPSNAADVIPTPARWTRDAVAGRRAIFSGEVVQTYTPIGRRDQQIYVLATTVSATISKSADGKTMTIDERVTPVRLKSYVTNLIESRGPKMRRIAVADTRLCGGRPGMTASYLAPDPDTGSTLTFDFAAMQSGPYIVDVLYSRRQGVAADPAAVAALSKLCVPAPSVLEAAYGVRKRH